MFLTQIADGKLRDVALCQECAKREGIFDPQQLSIAGQFFPKELSGHIERLISRILHGGEDDAEDLTHLPNHLFSLCNRSGDQATDYRSSAFARACPRCGYTSAEYKKTHLLGCPGCYETFRELLHEQGTDAHSSPTVQRGEINEGNREELEEQMHDAVEREDYEEAARLRDRIKELSK